MRLSQCFNMSQDVADSCKCFFYTFFLIINLNYDLALILFCSMAFDMAIGLIKATVLKDKITPGRFMFGFITKLLILIIPLTVAVLGMALNYDFKLFADFTIRILIANECLSILANILSVKNRERVENIDLITLFIKFIREKVQKSINSMFNNYK